MEKNLREIQEIIRFIQEEITKLKEQMDQKDSVMFLKEEARRYRRINVQELAVTDETLPVENFVHPYLLKTVLRETLDATNRVSVTLDVQTASPDLAVSEDRKSVRYTGIWMDLPDTGKRFTHWPCVLGSEGFTSGRHYWEVESVCVAHGNNDNTDSYKDKISRLESKFQNHFQVFSQLEKEFSLFCSAFAVTAASDVPEELQMELIEIQCNSALKYKFETLTHKHLNDIMKIQTAQKLVPDVDRLVKTNRCQVSGSSK
ncbi:zinc-binding protein A33-like [Hemitrygon akajei]|uniref:zinc-binding protein A33-like n=1 Tax=Hemitrygon akajei TaxID=2704970 RepID=UPI003BF9FBC0